MSLPPPEQVWLHSNRGDRFAASYRFEEPAGSILAHRPDDLCPALDDVENAVREGLHAVGLVTYEAAGAFDRALTSHEPDPILPRAWFGLYRRRCDAGASDLPTSTCTVGPSFS